MPALQKMLLSAVNSPGFDVLISGIEKVANRKQSILRVLTYHRVDNPEAQPQLSPTILSAIPRDFEQQMAFIAEHYQPVSIEQILQAVRGGSFLPERAVLITFDDGYCDFEAAWEVMNKHGIKPVLFIPTHYPDNPNALLWWDKLYHAIRVSEQASVMFNDEQFSLSQPEERERVFRVCRNYIKSLPHDEAMQQVNAICDSLQVQSADHNSIMTWEQLKILHEQGVDLAPHTVTHPLLNRISLDRAVEEASLSWEHLKQRIGDVPRVFAYPSGGATEAIAERLREVGFELAFTTKSGINDIQQWNPLLIRRINVGRKTSLNVMRARLLSWTVHLNRSL